MGLFSGGLTFGSFFVYQIVGLIFGWANFRVGLLSGVYGTSYKDRHVRYSLRFPKLKIERQIISLFQVKNEHKCTE